MRQVATTPLSPACCATDGNQPATADSYFQQQIRELRAYHVAAPPPDDAWVEFEDSEGVPYYFDFVNENRRDTHPLVRLRDSAIGGGSGDSTSLSVVDPGVFERATALHKMSSMKNLEQLEILCFHTWWTEQSLQGEARKRLAHIYFSVPTRHFQVVLEDTDDVFTISHVVGLSGRPLAAWDLHVGARIAVLGRLTTLMQASLLTCQWLQLHERRLGEVKHQLQTELVKFAHFVKPSAPAIPKKEQSYGYVQVGPDLKLQKQPATIYSGIGQDTVGPAAYNSHHEIWNERKNVAPSLCSTVKREVWEENAPRASVPGPGHYYDETAISDFGPTSKGGGSGLRGCKKSVKHERQSAVFASKVPILPDTKPTSHYDLERDLELNAKEARLRYQLERQKTNVMKAKIEAFGSTTGRVELSSQLSAPFSNPTFTLTPGPGMYTGRALNMPGQQKHRTPSSSSSSGGNRHSDEGIGFSSATERYCLSKSKKAAPPGPGAYRSETPRSLDHTVKSKLGIGRNGVFGTTSERRVWEQLERLEADELTPGPGAYEKPVETNAGHFPLAANSAAFKSGSLRFTKRSNPHAPPHVHCVGDQVAPAVGQYDISQSLALGGTSASGNVGSPPVSARGGGGVAAGAGFLSKSERAVFDTKDSCDLPGPGAYTEDLPRATTTRTRLNEARSSIGNEERFRVKPTVPESVGPGAYSIAGTVGSKSFNVTMVSATQQQEQYRAARSPRLRT
ncbi:hypothetical protein PybrP1_010785 [[Pythium] brassicae (nom. inval.)]|nr:hypothetical protein PybrP1_010785 [[Pythium] brassicae (nom. inval.)]